MVEIAIVQLLDGEQALYDSIIWNMGLLMDQEHETRIRNFERVGELAESLLTRRAVPQHRIDYFFEPELNIGGYGKSRKDAFERNGVEGFAILRDPGFMEILRYFIHGPELPPLITAGFCRIAEEDEGTTGEVLGQITAYARRVARTNRTWQSSLADKLFMLALEVRKPEWAEYVRKAAKSAR
ncbi:hypothetical protein [Singulisphaera acidiphila]|uniref:Uncharacterized protein n=1 Tax=Singulisphaera acidiphila (strain ATCC BAA-1392 / DSM 18658 / VKM B-2454 / MOB10) TaxID=886293 RepID=L0DB12_SINAD|nr:hypothetical protein [Singulisphaera acidiphila]AGA26028.1 hypothetical protein Sinac_1650 [Singulisphaera acidiphila DSM 18658]